jgi:putative transposase
MSVAVLQAYRVALDPTRARARNLERHASAARFAYNWALAAVRANIDQRAAERSYGLEGRPRSRPTSPPGHWPAASSRAAPAS